MARDKVASRGLTERLALPPGRMTGKQEQGGQVDGRAMAGPKPRAWGGWIDRHTWGTGNFLSSHSNILLILKKVGALQFTVHCS